MNNSFSQQSSQVERILVVDDIADNSFLLQISLENEGYKVEVADSGRTALDKIVVNPPDLLLLDVMMPEMSGLEVTKRIRQNPDLPFIPIFLVTGCSEMTPATGFDIGANGFICKPFDFDDLLKQIQTILLPRNLVNS